VKVDLGRLPVQVAVDAFDGWIGLNARVREALVTKGDVSSQLLGGIRVDSSELLCVMGVFMQFGMPLMVATAADDSVIDLQFTVTREAGAAARRALLALGGNGTLRAFNQAWSHRPTRAAEEALDLVDSRLVEQPPRRFPDHRAEAASDPEEAPTVPPLGRECVSALDRLFCRPRALLGAGVLDTRRHPIRAGKNR
jgi:hypothetical protein